RLPAASDGNPLDRARRPPGPGRCAVAVPPGHPRLVGGSRAASSGVRAPRESRNAARDRGWRSLVRRAAPRATRRSGAHRAGRHDARLGRPRDRRASPAIDARGWRLSEAQRLHVGTSGYSYPEGKGSFYPEKIRATEMLRFYAERFATVEVNNTFYRMPVATMLERWSHEVPESFTFVLKASRRITHDQRLRDVDETVGAFLRTASVLGPKL